MDKEIVMGCILVVGFFNKELLGNLRLLLIWNVVKKDGFWLIICLCFILYLMRFKYGLKLEIWVFLGKIDVKLVFYMING